MLAESRFIFHLGPSRASGNPALASLAVSEPTWMPASAGMTMLSFRAMVTNF